MTGPMRTQQCKVALMGRQQVCTYEVGQLQRPHWLVGAQLHPSVNALCCAHTLQITHRYIRIHMMPPLS